MHAQTDKRSRQTYKCFSVSTEPSKNLLLMIIRRLFTFKRYCCKPYVWRNFKNINADFLYSQLLQMRYYFNYYYIIKCRYTETFERKRWTLIVGKHWLMVIKSAQETLFT